MSGCGSGRSKTCRIVVPIDTSCSKAAAHPEQLPGRRSTTFWGWATCLSVSPLWPFWPPGFFPEASRRLRTRDGFFNPSLEGGLELLVLFSPRRYSSSPTLHLRATFSAAMASIWSRWDCICAVCASRRAVSESMRAVRTSMCAAWEAMMVRSLSSLDRSSDLARLIRILNRQTPGMSRQIAQSAILATSGDTWAVTNDLSLCGLDAK